MNESTAQVPTDHYENFMNFVVKVYLDILYLRLESLTALAASEARSKTPTTGFVTVPTNPLPKPEMRP
jgi:hypothetical protein